MHEHSYQAKYTIQSNMHVRVLYLSYQFVDSKNNDKAFHAVAVFPAYQSLYENLKSHDCDMDFWTAKMTLSGWTFDVDELEKLLKPNTRLLVVNFPHNPTGFLPSANDWARLIDVCKAKNIFLFSDEMYRCVERRKLMPVASFRLVVGVRQSFQRFYVIRVKVLVKIVLQRASRFSNIVQN